jgi:glyoxylase-like metal-dependent hydrolase (beta-lactamase superfamily II)
VSRVYDPEVTTLAAGLSWVDLRFLGRPHAIAAALVQGPGGLAIVDPGPTTCLNTLEEGLAAHGARLADLTHILLTHIHLDHAAATGTIVRRHPRVRVLVHEVGAPHMTDPARLIASATRLYGDQMDRLWGEFAPVPRQNIDVLSGGERLDIAGRTFEVAYTPGHASHHVSFFDRSSGVAFVGDTAGMSIDGGYVLPPTPPPDIDLVGWRRSVAMFEEWAPGTLFLTHFGPIVHVRTHLQTLLDNLVTTATLVKETLREEGSDEDRMARFSGRLRREMRRQMSDVQLESYGLSAPLGLQWLGLARYWRKAGFTQAG